MNPYPYEVTLQPQPHKRYKVFLVEEDDEDRERVISGIVNVASIKYENDYGNVQVDALLDSARIFVTQQTATMKLECVPGPDGTLFTMVNFSEEDEEEE